jgi:glutamine synthetase
MSNSADSEWAQLLAKHPDTRFVDAFVTDLNGVERGKRIDRGSADKIWSAGMPLPGSMFALDVLGATVQATGLGFDDGDADRPCRPVAGTLVPVPWDPQVAQLQLSMFEPDGRAFFGDPRHVLARGRDRIRVLFHRQGAQRRWAAATATAAADRPARVSHPDQLDVRPQRVFDPAERD